MTIYLSQIKIYLFSALTMMLLMQRLAAGQVPGCTDSLATNFNATANYNDGSCIYPNTQLSLNTLASLPSALNEISGQVFDFGMLWAINDAGNSPTLFAIDTANGQIIRRIHVANFGNIDWEAITADPYYFYVGDFGNNNGTRTDLRILKIAKTDVYKNPQKFLDTVEAVEAIRFRYGRQLSFSSSNNHNWDCEAMVFFKDTLHLFSKNRGLLFTYHYKLPAYDEPNTIRVLYPVDSFTVGMQVTDAAISQHGVLALVGYTTSSLPAIALWLFHDFKNGKFFNGHKRRLNMANALINGQTEGICFLNQHNGFISNERISQPPLNVTATLRKFDIKPMLMYTYRKPSPVPIIQLPFQGLGHGSGKPWFYYQSGTFFNRSVNTVDYTAWQITYQPTNFGSPLSQFFYQDSVSGPFPNTDESFPLQLKLITGNGYGRDSLTIRLKYTLSQLSEHDIASFNHLQSIVFPNPAQRTLWLKHGMASNPLPYHIYDKMGQLVQHGHTEFNGAIPVEYLSPGSYCLRLFLKSGQVNTRFLKW